VPRNTSTDRTGTVLTQTQIALVRTGPPRVAAAEAEKIIQDFYLARGVIRPCRISDKYQDRHCNHDSQHIVSIEMIGKIMGGRSGGRKKGCKNASTLWREAQASIGDGGLMVDVADPLEVIERVMRYFYSLGMQGAKNKAPIEDVQKCFNRALHAASIAAL
jgi:hypothetical protein